MLEVAGGILLAILALACLPFIFVVLGRAATIVVCFAVAVTVWVLVSWEITLLLAAIGALVVTGYGLSRMIERRHELARNRKWRSLMRR